MTDKCEIVSRLLNDAMQFDRQAQSGWVGRDAMERLEKRRDQLIKQALAFDDAQSCEAWSASSGIREHIERFATLRKQMLQPKEAR